MKIKVEWLLLIAITVIFIVSSINANIRYKNLETNYQKIISRMSELKKVNNELWEKTQTALDDIGSVKDSLSDFGKKMVKDDDLAGLFVALAEIKDTVSGQGEVSEEGKVSFEGSKEGFVFKGFTMYPSGKYEIDFGMQLQLEGYAKEVTPGVYETYLNTNNPKVKVKNFVFKVEPLELSFWKRFEFGMGLRYNTELGAGISGLIRNGHNQIDGAVFKGLEKSLGIELGYTYIW